MDRVEEPGSAFASIPLVATDGFGVLKGQPDLVQALDEHPLPERVDIEGMFRAVRSTDDLGGQIDLELEAPCGTVEESVHNLGRQSDRQHPVLETVVVKDVGKVRRNHGAKAVFGQGPYRVLAARTTAEVLPRKKNRRALVAWRVENEVRG